MFFRRNSSTFVEATDKLRVALYDVEEVIAVDYKALGNRIRSPRYAKGWTQETLANICEALNVSVDVILAVENKKTPEPTKAPR